MLYRMVGLFCVLGIALVVVAVLLFILGSKILGIPPIVFEATGIAMISFAFGNLKSKVLLGFLLASVVIATIFDPLVWNARGLDVQYANLVSIIVNGMIGFIIVIFYFIGSVIGKKFSLDKL